MVCVIDHLKFYGFNLALRIVAQIVHLVPLFLKLSPKDGEVFDGILILVIFSRFVFKKCFMMGVHVIIETNTLICSANLYFFIIGISVMTEIMECFLECFFVVFFTKLSSNSRNKIFGVATAILENNSKEKCSKSKKAFSQN